MLVTVVKLITVVTVLTVVIVVTVMTKKLVTKKNKIRKNLFHQKLFFTKSFFTKKIKYDYSKTQQVTKLKNSKCDKSQKLRFYKTQKFRMRQKHKKFKI